MSDSPKHPADPANELASDNSAIDPRDFRNALGTFATGVTIVTAMAVDGKPYGVTCNSFASVSLNPPLVLWSLSRAAASMSVFSAGSHYAINVLAADQRALAERFAVDLDDDDVDTVGGLLAKYLGRVPIPGAQVQVNGLELTAEGTQGRRNQLDTVVVRRVEDVEDGAADLPDPVEAKGG